MPRKKDSARLCAQNAVARRQHALVWANILQLAPVRTDRGALRTHSRFPRTTDWHCGTPQPGPGLGEGLRLGAFEQSKPTRPQGVPQVKAKQSTPTVGWVGSLKSRSCDVLCHSRSLPRTRSGHLPDFDTLRKKVCYTHSLSPTFPVPTLEQMLPLKHFLNLPLKHRNKSKASLCPLGVSS